MIHYTTKTKTTSNKNHNIQSLDHRYGFELDRTVRHILIYLKNKNKISNLLNSTTTNKQKMNDQFH